MLAACRRGVSRQVRGLHDGGRSDEGVMAMVLSGCDEATEARALPGTPGILVATGPGRVFGKARS